MSSTLDDIRAAFDQIGDVFRADDYAQACAIGVWTDDPQHPGVTAVVFQGKLYSLSVPNSWRVKDPRELTDVINAVLINAYAEWALDRARLAQSAARRSA